MSSALRREQGRAIDNFSTIHLTDCRFEFDDIVPLCPGDQAGVLTMAEGK
jgi:hypothetical protein